MSGNRFAGLKNDYPANKAPEPVAIPQPGLEMAEAAPRTLRPSPSVKPGLEPINVQPSNNWWQPSAGQGMQNQPQPDPRGIQAPGMA